MERLRCRKRVVTHALVWNPACLHDAQGVSWRKRTELYSNREFVVQAFMAGHTRSGMGIEGTFKIGKKDGSIRMLIVPTGH